MADINRKSYLAKYAAEELKAGRMDRRTFLSLTVAAGAAATLVGLGRPATAASGEIVFANWGGQSDTDYKTIFADTFTKDTGIVVSTDTSGPYRSKIEKMADENAVVWDTTDGDRFDTIALARGGYLQPIDWSVVDRDRMYPEFFMDEGMAAYAYSFVIVYDADAFADRPPQSFADFWNLKDFPGQRALWKYMSTLEPALLADGIDPAALYPLDLPRAARKLTEIKNDTIFYDSFAQCAQAVRDGEVSMAVISNSHAKRLHLSTAGKKTFTYSQGQICMGQWPAIKNNPGGRENLMKFFASVQQPEVQVRIAQALGFSPANPEAFAMLPAEDQKYDPMTAENRAKQYFRDEEYYAEHYGEMVDIVLETIS
jgi:putative spermidine/putrescine transport system substrate-binding protein